MRSDELNKISPSKEKLIGDWRKTTEGLTEAGAELLLFTTVNAFKFPDNGQVYITCNVQVSFYTSLYWTFSREQNK